MTTTQPRRVTSTTPACPTWCTVPRETHVDEAVERDGSWYSHRSGPLGAAADLEGALVAVEVVQLQFFEEQLAVGEEPVQTSIWVDGRGLRSGQAKQLAGLLTDAATI